MVQGILASDLTLAQVKTLRANMRQGDEGAASYRNTAYDGKFQVGPVLATSPGTSYSDQQPTPQQLD